MYYTEANQLDQDTQVTVGEVRAAVTKVVTEHYEDSTEHENTVLATDVIKSIFDSRERQWRAGDVVRDAEGGIWQRVSASQWKRTGRAGMYSHSRPVRPLRLLCSPQDEADNERRLKALDSARDDGMPA